MLDRKAFIERNLKQKKARSVEVAKEEYKNAIEFCRCVLRAYETGDYTDIVTRIWQKRNPGKDVMEIITPDWKEYINHKIKELC